MYTRPRLAFATAVVAATALFLAPLPDLGFPRGDGDGARVPWDKVGHVAILAGLGLLGRRAWPGAAPAIYLGLVVYALAVEGAQALVPHRSADLLDAAAGALGALAAFLPPGR